MWPNSPYKTYKAIGQNFWLFITKGQLYSLNYRLQVQKKWLSFVNQVLWLTYCQSPIEALSFLTIDYNGNSLLSLIYCHLSIVFYLLLTFLVQISISNVVIIIGMVENDNDEWSCQDQLSYFWLKLSNSLNYRLFIVFCCFLVVNWTLPVTRETNCLFLFTVQRSPTI